MERVKTFLLIIFALVAIALIVYSIQAGSNVQKIDIAGLFGIQFEPSNNPPVESPSSASPPNDLAVKYTMDQEDSRVIVVTHLSGVNYRIEEPSGSYPWAGTATLDGGQLQGEANFKESLASMRVEGTRRSDGSIAVRYIFITDSEGNPADGRVDRHVWYPVP